MAPCLKLSKVLRRFFERVIAAVDAVVPGGYAEVEIPFR